MVMLCASMILYSLMMMFIKMAVKYNGVTGQELMYYYSMINI